MYSTITTLLENRILTITINRPEKLNALNRDVMTDIDAAINEVLINKDIRSAVITGSGEKAFIAGADIAEFQGLSAEEGLALAKRGADIFSKIESCPKPIIAAINGFALGGGCELAMACHLRVCTASSKFGQPEVGLGLIPGYGGTQRLPQLIGKGRALELLLAGYMLDAKSALQYGLVNHVVDSQELLLSTCYEMLGLINSKAPLAIASIIEAVNALYCDGKNGHQIELEGFANCFVTEDMQEGVTAFLEKRKPHFKGK
jgi:enoyl-CoA hydratase